MSVFHKILSVVSQKLKADHRLEETIEFFQSTEDLNEKFCNIDQLERNGYFQRPQIQPRTPKNNEESTTYRTLGNKEFAKQTNAGYLAALKYYNKSICYAENDSEELGLGFANRSAVYFELGLYDDCMKNIQLAKQSAPSHVMDKLNNREKECLQQEVSAKNTLPIVSPELSFPANHQIPFIVNCLELQRNEQYGRHIITKRNLKPGDVVAIEKSFCSILNPKFNYVRCENCLKENNYNLLPCTQCVSVMFCTECRDEAYEKFHKIECPIIDLMAKFLCKSSRITFRTVVRAITSFNSIDELVTFIEETKGQDLTIFDYNYKEKSSHNLYAPVHFSTENFDADKEFATCMLVSLISRPLLKLTELKDKFNTVEAVTVLKGLIYRCITRGPSVCSYAAYLDGSLFDAYAEGIYPFRNLLNHSCVPNVMITSSNNKLVYTVSRPINADEQLFDHYEYIYFPPEADEFFHNLLFFCRISFRSHSLIERQQLLKHFHCQCKACECNYPMESDVRAKNIPNLRIMKPLSKHSLTSCAAYLNKYARWYPCKQLFFAEDELRCQLEMLCNEESMGKRYK